MRRLTCFFLLITAASAQTAKLLPTAPLARHVKELGKLLSESAPGTTVESRRKAGFTVRDKIGQFIVDQIESKQDITKEQLEAQLRAILCPTLCSVASQPSVLSLGEFGPRGMQFAVAYQLSLGCMGPQCAITVLQSFFVENRRVKQRGAPGGSEFDAYVANFQLIAGFVEPSEIWVLAWGQLEGSSGRGISGRATLYRVSLDEVKVAWDDAREVNVSAQKSLIGWEFMYADKELLYRNDPKPYFFDVYQINYRDRSVSRLMHHQLND